MQPCTTPGGSRARPHATPGHRRALALVAMPDNGQPPQPQPEPELPSQSPSQSQPDKPDRTDPHPPLPRDKRGWQVAPSPDGRGMPEHADTPPPAHRTRGFLWFVIALLAFNWLLGARLRHAAKRRTAGDGAVQPLLPRTGEGRARQKHQHQGQHRRGQLHGQAPLPAQRRKGDLDQTLRDRGADASGTAASCRPCCRKSTSRSTPNRPPRKPRCWPSCCSASAPRC